MVTSQLVGFPTAAKVMSCSRANAYAAAEGVRMWQLDRAAAPGGANRAVGGQRQSGDSVAALVSARGWASASCAAGASFVTYACVVDSTASRPTRLCNRK